MDTEPVPGAWSLDILGNRIVGPLVLDPRTQAQLETDGNLFLPATAAEVVRLQIPWHERVLEFVAPRRP